MLENGYLINYVVMILSFVSRKKYDWFRLELVGKMFLKCHVNSFMVYYFISPPNLQNDDLDDDKYPNFMIFWRANRYDV